MAEQELSTKPKSIKEVLEYIDVKFKSKTSVQEYIDNNNITGDFNSEERIKNLEDLVARLAVMTGQGNILFEYGIERWLPGKKDMNKYG